MSVVVAPFPAKTTSPRYFCQICRQAHDDDNHQCGDLLDSIDKVVDRALGQPSIAARSPQALFLLRYEIASALIRACSALRSYACGNQSPVLAQEVAGHLDAVIKKVLGEI
jgi:hypothetical protein